MNTQQYWKSSEKITIAKGDPGTLVSSVEMLKDKILSRITDIFTKK